MNAREAAVLVEAGKASENGHFSPKTQAAAKLQLIYLSQTKSDLESKVARLQARDNNIRTSFKRRQAYAERRENVQEEWNVEKLTQKPGVRSHRRVYHLVVT